MSDKPHRILTPAEAMALSGPSVQSEIVRINRELRQGIRSFWIHEPLWPVIREEFEAQGWACVEQRLVAHGIISCMLSPASPAVLLNDEELVGAYKNVIAKDDCL